MEVDLEHVVAHPVGRVFGLMSDLSKRALWQERSSDVEVLTPGPVGLGTRWREHTRGVGDAEGEVVGFQPDALWAERGVADGGTAEVTVAFSPEGEDATRLDIVVKIELRGTRRLLEPALGPAVRHQLPQDLRRLEALLAGEAGDEPAFTPP